MKCLSCNNYKHASVDGASCQLCSAVVANCFDCDEVLTSGAVSGAICTDCVSPFYANSTGSCITCDDATWNCADCEEDGNGSFECTTCNDGFWLNATNHRCVGCPANCATCSSATVCLTCTSASYYLHSNDTCVLCTVNNTSYATCSYNSGDLEPLSCIDGFYLDESGLLNTCNNCTAANAAYQHCTSPTFALTCSDGYYLVSDDCVTCSGIDINWATCDDTP